MHEPQKHAAQGKEPDAKGHVLQDSTYRKCPEEIDLWRQKADCWVQGLGEGQWGLTANGRGVFFAGE